MFWSSLCFDILISTVSHIDGLLGKIVGAVYEKQVKYIADLQLSFVRRFASLWRSTSPRDSPLRHCQTEELAVKFCHFFGSCSVRYSCVVKRYVSYSVTLPLSPIAPKTFCNSLTDKRQILISSFNASQTTTTKSLDHN